jgi:hypothetical protein
MGSPKRPPKPITLAALRSAPPPEALAADIRDEFVEGERIWCWSCPYCGEAVTEPDSDRLEVRPLLTFDPACLRCRAEAAGLDMAAFRKLHRAGALVGKVTCPGPDWRSRRMVSYREGRFTAGTRIAWDTAAEWCAGYEEIRRRRGRIAGEVEATLTRHVRALERELELIEGAPLEDVEWIDDLIRGRSVGSLVLIDACDRRKARLRQVNGDDGSRVYAVVPPGDKRPGEPWIVYRKGGVGLARVPADLAAGLFAAHMNGRPKIYVRGRVTVRLKAPVRLSDRALWAFELDNILTAELPW